MLWSREGAGPSKDEPLLGALVNSRWRISEYIFSGSFGHCWRAKDTLLSERLVCLKIMRAPHDPDNRRKLDDPKWIGRHRIECEEELKVCRRLKRLELRHPFLVNTLEVTLPNEPKSIMLTNDANGNVLHGNMHYVVMDLCEGDWFGPTSADVINVFFCWWA